MKLQPVKLAKTKFSNQRGIPTEETCLIVNGFSKDVLNKLPMEFAEAQKLLEISLEGSVR
jgi:Fe-S cluster assembly protein SufB